MRKRWILGVVGVLVLFLAGCGDGGSPHPPPPLNVVDILSSDGALDGDITFDPLAPVGFEYSPVISSTPPNIVLVGFDPLALTPRPESRGFITFALGSVPPGAIISRATVFLPVLRVSLISPPSVVLLIDMVSFAPLDTLTQEELAATFLTTPILLGPSVEVFPGDAGTDKTFDATDAVIKARNLGLSRLQLRITGSFGLLTIVDLDPELGGIPPLLSVEYTF